jgi:uracil DNA glycosylase
MSLLNKSRFDLQYKADWSNILDCTNVNSLLKKISRDYSIKSPLGLRLSCLDNNSYLIPHPVFILNVFRFTDPYNLRFILIVDNIPLDKNYKGIPLDKNIGYTTTISSPDVVTDNLKYNNLSQSFNIYKWMSQGCLPLAVSLTKDNKDIEIYTELWSEFIEKLLQELDIIYENKLPVVTFGLNAAWLTRNYNSPVIQMPKAVKYPNGEYDKFIKHKGFDTLNKYLIDQGDCFIF